MSRANVGCIPAIRDFRNRFLILGEELSRAVANGLLDLKKTTEWLRHERSSYWKQELFRGREKLLRAREDYNRAQAAVRETGGTALRERRAVEAVEARLRDAEQRMEKTRHWAGELSRLGENLLGPCRRLKGQLDESMPLALSRLDAVSTSLEAYADISSAPRAKESEENAEAQALAPEKDP